MTAISGRRKLPIAREGYPFVGAALALAAVLSLTAPAVVAGAAAFLAVFVVGFFRDPERFAPEGERRLVSPADGRVIGVDRVEDGRHLRGPATRVSIFMSPLNVHVNRAPASGTVEGVHYHPGKYFRAFAEKASADNEQNAIVLRDAAGRELCFVQIAGFVARRIVCYLHPGMAVRRGERCGMIMFGSRVDVYLPLAVRVEVAVGDRVRGGESVLGEWPE